MVAIACLLSGVVRHHDSLVYMLEPYGLLGAAVACGSVGAGAFGACGAAGCCCVGGLTLVPLKKPRPGPTNKNQTTTRSTRSTITTVTRLILAAVVRSPLSGGGLTFTSVISLLLLDEQLPASCRRPSSVRTKVEERSDLCSKAYTILVFTAVSLG